MDEQLYEIVRYYHPSQKKESEVIATDKSLEEVREWCNDPDTHVEGFYFDGYRRQ
jgi:uncharacterized protein YciI